MVRGKLVFVTLVVFFSVLRVGFLSADAPELHGRRLLGWEDSSGASSNASSNAAGASLSGEYASSGGEEEEEFDPCAGGEEAAEDLPSACPTAFDNYAGGVLYLVGIVYCFVGLAIICEGEFKDSIIEMASFLRISPDIAGATLMAGGTSSPELFTALVAIFGPVDDIGMGTIVGSAIFNLLIIIGGCVVFSSYTFHLDWKPVMRDASMNYLSFLFLLAVFWDGKVRWYESVIGVALYVFYVATMAVNTHTMNAMDWVATRVLELMPFLSFMQRKEAPGSPSAPQAGEGDEGNLLDDFEERVGDEQELDTFGLDEQDHQQQQEDGKEAPDSADALASASRASLYDDERLDTEEVQERSHHRPTGALGWLWLWLALPYELTFRYTVPPVKGRFRLQFFASFAMSLFWLGVLTTGMVKWTEQLGCILGISDAVMGVTFLAVGTSMPDCLTSIFVAQTGRGNMAVCNALGSNIFDILFALCLPWVFSACLSLIAGTSTIVCVGSKTIKQDVVILSGTLTVLLVSLVIMRWRLSRPVGYFLYFLYVVFIVYTVLRELNILTLF